MGSTSQLQPGEGVEPIAANRRRVQLRVTSLTSPTAGRRRLCVLQAAPAFEQIEKGNHTESGLEENLKRT